MLHSDPKFSGCRKAFYFLLRGYTWHLVALVLVFGLLAFGSPLSSGPEPIVLRAEPMPFTPKEFFISDVVDERADKKAVAYLLVAGSTTQPAKPVAVDLQGGGHVAIREYIRQNLKRDTKLRPVVARLQEFKTTEKPGATGRVDGQLVVRMIFELKREGKNVPLVEYRGGARYSRSATQQIALEPLLRQSLVESLRYLNTWMDKEADNHEQLARGVKVHFKDYKAEAADDTVFYEVDRPLTWNDFRGHSIKPSKYAAAVFSSFAYDGQSEVKNGIVHLDLTMKVFMVPSASWAKEAAGDPYSLNHEQRHFDITKLVAERFKQKIKPDSLTVEDYNSMIQYQFIESFREMNRLQEQYDSETQHGLDRVAQENWNRRIDEELRSFSVKK